MQKIYCFVDESGQHTLGSKFIVSVVITQNRDELEHNLLKTEKESNKNKVKWIQTQQVRKYLYLDQILELEWTENDIYYSIFEDSKDYKALTVLAVVKAVKDKNYLDNKSSIFIDGLNKHEIMWFSREIRRHGLKTDKIRGLKDQNSAIIRLADSVAGFVFEVEFGDKTAKKYFKNVIEKRKPPLLKRV